MLADSTTVLNATGPGRNAQRIVSNNQYTTSVIVLDVAHMPQGCGCVLGNSAMQHLIDHLFHGFSEHGLPSG